MDSQRPYSTEPPPWYNDRDDQGRPPGQRDPRYGDRYPDDAAFPGDQRYPDESRFGDDAGYGGGYQQDESRYDSGERFEAPDPRYEGDQGRGEPGRSRGARSGLELPEGEPDPPREESQARYRTEMLDRGQLRRPPGDPMGAGQSVPPGPGSGPPLGVPAGSPTSTVYQAGATPTQAIPAAQASGGMPREAYRARRSGVAGLLAAVAVVAELLIVVKVLADSVAAHPTNTGGVLAGVFATCGIPMVALGLYGLATGAATASGPNVGRAWLRTPLAYLPVGLALIIAAGLAA